MGETVWYEDTDGDGYGNVASPLPACDQPTGYVANYDDCDDGNIQTSPNAFEVCATVSTTIVMAQSMNQVRLESNSSMLT